MSWFRDSDLVFKKTGAEIKKVARSRIADLETRIAKRNDQLDRIMEDKPLLRSYLVRNPRND